MASLHRVHRSAIAGNPAGTVDEAEFRVICERLAKVSDLELSNMIVRNAAKLADRLARREACP